MTRSKNLQLDVLLYIIAIIVFFQAIGVASGVSFIGSVMESKIVVKNRRLDWAYEKLGTSSTQSFVVFTGTD